MRLYYWIHHTGDSEGGTGVQRVVRNLAATLIESGHEVLPVRWDDVSECVVLAEKRWTTGLARQGGPTFPIVHEGGTPLHLSSAYASSPDGWLLLPEVPHVAGDEAPSLPVVLDYARFYGLRTAAIFYDLIPLRQPGYEEMVADHECYAHALVATDLLLAISAYSAEDLQSWWAEHGYEGARLPRVQALPLPHEMRGVPRMSEPTDPAAPPIRFLALGSVEPRKNQLEALRAFARLCARRPDLDLRFDVVGGLHPAVADAVHQLVEQEPRIRLHRYLPDADVRHLVEAAHATVFVSLDEGFGLPIAESLWQGTPCLSSDHGSMAEIAVGGGCLTVPATDGSAVERGLERLAEDSQLRRALSDQACSRDLRTWRDYGNSVLEAIGGMPAAPHVVVLEGSRGGAEPTVAKLAARGAAVRSLHWHPKTGALLPGTAQTPVRPAPGSGYLDGLWGLLPHKTCEGGEAELMVDTAKGLGLRVAVEGGADAPPRLLSQADMVLFSDEDSRDEALSGALRELPKTVGLRKKLAVSRQGDALAPLAAAPPRIPAGGPPQPFARIYYWAGLTAEQPMNTGIQRVTRMLAAALQRRNIEVVPVGWDASTGRMTHVDDKGMANLARWNGPTPRPVEPLPEDLRGQWLLLPEITVPVVPPASDVAKYARSRGMRSAAIFHDLIPEKLPELYSQAALDNLRAYWRTFGSVDLALPNSWSSAADLIRYLRGEDMRLPLIIPCPLAADPGGQPRTNPPVRIPEGNEPLRLLVVGTWERRKNYPVLLRALAAAQARANRALHLTIVGRRAGDASLDEEIISLATAVGAELVTDADDDELLRRYEHAHATVFPSWEEGFGLPVVESLWYGRPCLCHNSSAMAELAPGGGVLPVDVLDKQALAAALLRVSEEPELLDRLAQEATARKLRTWDEYAEDVLLAISRAGSLRGWPLPAVVKRRPLLSCAITTYNRAPWLAHSLPRLLEATRPWRDVVEVVVCDNSSTDTTPELLAQFQGERNFRSHRNATNVGMLGNLGATARLSRGAFVWLLGDDDLLVDGALENVLDGLATHPDVEMAYLNYAYTSFEGPQRLADATAVVRNATPIADGGQNRYVKQLREVAAANENLFTAIYACVFRRDHALRAYQVDTRGAPFSSLATCVPSSVYALGTLQDRPAWWVGDPAVVVNMNVSWLRWALLWHLERMPDLYEEAELQGIDPIALDRYRLQHLVEAEQWVRAAYFEAEDQVRDGFSMARMLERSKHLHEFRKRHLAGVRAAYAEAWAAGRVAADDVPPDELFARYGL